MKPILAALLCCGCWVPPGGLADGGDLLDPSFGSDGRTQTSFACPGWAYPNALVTRGDAGFVAAGHACKGWALVGYTAAGGLDPSFGDAGTVMLFTGKGDFYDIRSLETRPDGRMIARGAQNNRDSVQQFSPTGALDEAFGARVDQVLSYQTVTFIQAVALQPDGKVLIASGGRGGATLLRVLIDGSPDSTFGSGGSAWLALFPEVFLTRLLVQPDGRIVLCGNDPSSGFPGVHFVARLSASGALDSSFGTGGVVKLHTQPGGTIWIWDAALQRDGKVVLAGSVRSVSPTQDRAALWRFTADGVLDAAFGASGKAEAPSTGGRAAFSAVTALADGKIVAVGRYHRTTYADSWLVARFTGSGELDPEFGSTGFSVFDVGLPVSPGGAYAVVATEGGYAIAGRSFSGASGPSVFGLARVLP